MFDPIIVNIRSDIIMTDTSKYKSVAVPIETWKAIHQLADEDTRTPGKVIQWLVKKEMDKREKENRN